VTVAEDGIQVLATMAAQEIDAVLARSAASAGDAPQANDITVLAFRFRG
jgi:hypothetical protein